MIRTTKERCRRLLADTYGAEGVDAFDEMPIRVTPDAQSHIVLDPIRAVVNLYRGATEHALLHETAHYLSWLWHRGELMTSARHGENARIEAAALLPHASLARLGDRTAIRIMCDCFDESAPYPAAALIAMRSFERFPTLSLRDLISPVLRGRA